MTWNKMGEGLSTCKKIIISLFLQNSLETFVNFVTKQAKQGLKHGCKQLRYNIIVFGMDCYLINNPQKATDYYHKFNRIIQYRCK